MKQNYEPKLLFVERMKTLLGADFEKYWKKVNEPELKTIRVNTLKISPEKLRKRLAEKSWILKQPFKNHKEILIVEGKLVDENNIKVQNDMFINSKRAGTAMVGGQGPKSKVELEPGELGKSIEHLLGYYYIQELASMLPAIALNPKPNEFVLDLCSAPGSKTTQMSAMMNNKGTIIANDPMLNRIKILASNLERCGCTNTIITRKKGEVLCKKFKDSNFRFDKILIDAPCSGEGTIRSNKKTLLMWNEKNIKSLSKIQKNLLEKAIEILNIGGEIVYSTCTHAPEENEAVLNRILKKFPNMKIEKVFLPEEIKCASPVLDWENESFSKEILKTCRIYPHITNTEGFFISKIKKIK